MTRRPLALAFVLLALGGCDRIQPPDPDVAAPDGPDDPQHLQAAFEEIVAAARREDAAAVLAGLERFLLTREELVALFGPERGEAVWPGYSDEVAGALRAEAAQVIIARVRDGLTEVRVDRVGPAYPARTTPGDQAMLDAFVPRGLAMYSVWLRKPGETLGLRFNGFIFRDGRWRALLKAYAHFPQADAPGELEAEEEAEGAADPPEAAPPEAAPPEAATAP